MMRSVMVGAAMVAGIGVFVLGFYVSNEHGSPLFNPMAVVEFIRGLF